MCQIINICYGLCRCALLRYKMLHWEERFFVILKVEVFSRELERSRQFMSMKNILMPMAIFFGIRWIWYNQQTVDFRLNYCYTILSPIEFGGRYHEIWCQDRFSSFWNLPGIRGSRAAYKAFGRNSGRYSVSSSEALLRRIRRGDDLYHINSVVDVNNLISNQPAEILIPFVKNRL